MTMVALVRGKRCVEAEHAGAGARPRTRARVPALAWTDAAAPRGAVYELGLRTVADERNFLVQCLQEMLDHGGDGGQRGGGGGVQ